MKQRIYIFAATVVLTTIFAFVQAGNNNDSIVWSAKTKLAWTDFKGKVDDKKNIPSYAYVLISYNSALKPDSMYITVTNVFYRDYSWVTSAGKTKEQLKHQQGCFDIVEIACRKFREEISKMKFFKSNTNDVLRALYSQAIKNKNNMLMSYTNETKNGSDKTKQAEWDKKIAADLKKYEKHSAYLVPIKMY